jgi:hypothetical protein
MPPVRWEDYDGSEHPYGELPHEWPETSNYPENQVNTCADKQSEENIIYSEFVKSIVEGLDENIQKHIYN